MPRIRSAQPDGQSSRVPRRAWPWALRLGALAAAWMVAVPFAEGRADASRIVYGCAPDLCVADPASGVSAAITTDGAQSPYRYPSISRDGRRVAAARGSAVVVGDYGGNLTERWAGTRDMNDVAIAPDGSGVGESHSYVENVYGCPLTGGCLRLVDRSATFYSRGGVPSEGSRRYPGGGGVGFLGTGALLSSRYTIDDDMHRICVVADPTADDAPCEPRISSSTTLTAPAGSPDGTLIAVATAAPEPSDAMSVNLHDAATGALVRRLAAAGTDPTFSPDGKQVAYAGFDGWIYVVPTKGGRSRRLVQGLSPAWGGGDGPGPAVTSRSLRYRKGRVAVKVRCGGSSTCRGTLRLKKGKTTLGSRSYRVKAGKSATVSVKPTSRGRRRIARSRKHKLTVQLTPKQGKAISRRITLRR
jgi:hypothetical protein